MTWTRFDTSELTRFEAMQYDQEVKRAQDWSARSVQLAAQLEAQLADCPVEQTLRTNRITRALNAARDDIQVSQRMLDAFGRPVEAGDRDAETILTAVDQWARTLPGAAGQVTVHPGVYYMLASHLPWGSFNRWLDFDGRRATLVASYDYEFDQFTFISGYHEDAREWEGSSDLYVPPLPFPVDLAALTLYTSLRVAGHDSLSAAHGMGEALRVKLPPRGSVREGRGRSTSI